MTKKAKIVWVKYTTFALINQRRAPLFERLTLFISCESSTLLHHLLFKKQLNNETIPYLYFFDRIISMCLYQRFCRETNTSAEIDSA
ncbi:MAG: hypothetical protein SOZ25_09270, partial [Prevotella sp.]|nr:hypothetical protein [Prevotella sp.]